MKWHLSLAFIIIIVGISPKTFGQAGYVGALDYTNKTEYIGFKRPTKKYLWGVVNRDTSIKETTILSDQVVYTVKKNFTVITYFNSTIIKSKRDLDYFSEQVIQIDPWERFIVLAGNIYKKGKGIFNIDSTDVFFEKDVLDANRQVFSNLKISLPDLQVGDIVNIYYQTYTLNDRVYLDFYTNGYFAKRGGSVEVSIPQQVQYNNGIIGSKMEYRGYNGIDTPEVTTKGSRNIIKWRYGYQKKIEPELYSIPSEKLPHFKLWINNGVFLKEMYEYGAGALFYSTTNIKNVNWNTAIQFFKTFSPVRQIKDKQSNYTKKFYKECLEKDSIKTPLNQLVLIHKKINQEIELIPPGNLDQTWSTGKCLAEQKIDFQRLMILYYDLLQELSEEEDFEFRLGLCRNRFLGDIDPGFYSPKQISKIFFAILYQEKTHILFPKTIYNSFELDETPSDQYGTSSIILDPSQAAHQTKAYVMKMPYRNDNIKRYTGEMQLNFETEEIKFRMRVFNQGYWYTYDKIQYQKEQPETEKLLKEIFGENTELDTVFRVNKSKTPTFNSTNEFNVTLKNSLIHAGDNSFLIDLKNQLLFQYQGLPTEDRVSDFYPTCKGVTEYKFYINSPKPIELLNSGKFNESIDNKYLSYKSEIQAINKKVLLLQAKFSVKEDFVPATDFEEAYSGFIKAIDQLKDASLLVRVLE